MYFVSNFTGSYYSNTTNPVIDQNQIVNLSCFIYQCQFSSLQNSSIFLYYAGIDLFYTDCVFSDNNKTSGHGCNIYEVDSTKVNIIGRRFCTYNCHILGSLSDEGLHCDIAAGPDSYVLITEGSAYMCGTYKLGYGTFSFRSKDYNNTISSCNVSKISCNRNAAFFIIHNLLFTRISMCNFQDNKASNDQIVRFMAHNSRMEYTNIIRNYCGVNMMFFASGVTLFYRCSILMNTAGGGQSLMGSIADAIYILQETAYEDSLSGLKATTKFPNPMKLFKTYQCQQNDYPAFSCKAMNGYLVNKLDIFVFIPMILL